MGRLTLKFTEPINDLYTAESVSDELLEFRKLLNLILLFVLLLLLILLLLL